MTVFKIFVLTLLETRGGLLWTAAAIVDVAFRFVMISSPPVSHFGGVDLDSLPFRKQGQEAVPRVCCRR